MGSSYLIAQPRTEHQGRSHTCPRERGRMQALVLEVLLIFNTSWSQNAQGCIQPQLKAQHSSLPYWPLRNLQRDLLGVLIYKVR